MLTDSVRVLSIEERIVDLRSRGLRVSDEDLAGKQLRRIGQYRLKQYWHVFQDAEVEGRRPFKPGYSFDDVLNLYRVDRELRGLLVKPLEVIEINLRSAIASYLQHRELTFAIYEDGFLMPFHDKPRINEVHSSVLKYKKSYSALQTFEERAYPEVMSMVGNQRDDFLRNQVRYPIWLVVEAISFTDLSILFEGLDVQLRKEIVKSFPGWDEYALKMFIKRLSVLRNSVAHHSRVWNKPLLWPGGLPRSFTSEFERLGRLRASRVDTVFDALTMLLDLMPKLDDEGSTWNHDVGQFVARQPAWILAEMGFPENWKHYSLWQ